MRAEEPGLWSVRVVDFDLSHHAPIFMFHNVAVIHESSQDFPMRERYSYTDSLVWRDTDGVYVSVERFLNAVAIHHLEIYLVNMEHMHLIRAVLNGPLLNTSKRNASVDAIVVKSLVVDRVIAISLTEYDGAKGVNVHAGEILRINLPLLRHL